MTSANLATDRQKSKAELLQELERLRRTVADLQAASTSALEQQLIEQRRRLEPLSSELALAEEREVLQLVAEGYSGRRIASKLHLSPKTVSTHRQRIMDKLGIHNAVGLTKYAIEFGLTSVETGEPS